MNLEEFFDTVEADQAAHVEDVKDYASTPAQHVHNEGRRRRVRRRNYRHQPNAKPLA